MDGQVVADRRTTLICMALSVIAPLAAVTAMVQGLLVANQNGAGAALPSFVLASVLLAAGPAAAATVYRNRAWARWAAACFLAPLLLTLL